MVKNDNQNRKDHLKVVDSEHLKTASERNVPPKVIFPDLVPKKSEEIWNDIKQSMDIFFSVNSPRLAGSGFVAKCEMLGAREWTSIIEPVREKHQEIHSWSYSQILKYLYAQTDDPLANQIYYRLKQNLL